MNPRIYFIGNPWPEGHPIKDFSWSLIKNEQGYSLHFDIVTAEYSAERSFPEEAMKASNWESPMAWNNYFCGSIHGGFHLCNSNTDPIKTLTKGPHLVDMLQDNVSDIDDLVFEPYILGHDAMAFHEILIEQNSAGNFDINWKGKIALIYSGEKEFNHEFKAVIPNVPAPTIEGQD